MIAVTRIRELNLTAPTEPGRPSHVSAASGLVRVQSFLYVIADDELHLGIFEAERDEPGRSLRLLEGTLPGPLQARKRHKPDMEAITLLPADDENPHGALLVIGSGSRPNRKRGVLLALDLSGAIAGAPRIVDLSPVYAALEREFPDLNIEGAVVVGEEMRLLQRGNTADGRNAVIRFLLRDVKAALTGSAAAIALLAIDDFNLGDIDGVPLSFTDAAALPDGRMVFSAVAEDTDNPYDDGRCAGAAIGIIDGGKLLRLERLDGACKIEGISARTNGTAIDLLLVTDADNADIAAELSTARLG